MQQQLTRSRVFLLCPLWSLVSKPELIKRRVTAGCQNNAGTGKNMYSESVYAPVKREICMKVDLSVRVRLDKIFFDIFELHPD